MGGRPARGGQLLLRGRPARPHASSTIPADLRRRTLETAVGLYAAGLDPDVCTVFVQSHVHEHTELSWLLECTATIGELGRMIQYKEKSAGKESVRAGLLTYPVLMAADILLYDADQVPVGDDQRQHLELARDLAIRYNRRYGETFVVPEAVVPKVAARVMDLQHPERKMSKSVESPLGTLNILDTPAEIAAKVRKAVTDTDGEVRYDPARATRPRQPPRAPLGRHRPADRRARLVLRQVRAAEGGPGGRPRRRCSAPVKARYEELAGDEAAIESLLEKGAAKAAAVASVTLHRAKEAIGLLTPST